MLTSSLAGKSCKIFSILDGDIKQECEQKYQKGHKFHGLQKENFGISLSIPITIIYFDIKKKYNERKYK